MLFLDVEVRSHIINLDNGWVKDIDLSGSSKDQILSALDTKSAQTNNEYLHLNKFAHSFHTKGTNLTGV
jgi:hypothetical protein